MEWNAYISKLFISAIDEINANLDDEMKIEYSEDMIFIGKESPFDSMDRVRLIDYLESALEDEKDIHLELLDDPWFAEITTCTVNDFKSFIIRKIEKEDK